MCERSSIKIIIVIYLLIANIAEAKRSYRLTFTKITCIHNVPEYVKIVVCSLAVHNNTSYLNSHIILRQYIQAVDIRIRVDIERKNKQRSNIIDVRLDGCAAIKSVHKLKFFEIVRNRILKTINVIGKCPMKPNFNYTLTDFSIDENELPSYVPEGNFYLKYIYYANKSVDAVGYTDIVGKIIYQSDKQNKNK